MHNGTIGSSKAIMPCRLCCSGPTWERCATLPIRKLVACGRAVPWCRSSALYFFQWRLRQRSGKISFIRYIYVVESQFYCLRFLYTDIVLYRNWLYYTKADCSFNFSSISSKLKMVQLQGKVSSSRVYRHRNSLCVVLEYVDGGMNYWLIWMVLKFILCHRGYAVKVNQVHVAIEMTTSYSQGQGFMWSILAVISKTLCMRWKVYRNCCYLTSSGILYLLPLVAHSRQRPFPRFWRLIIGIVRATRVVSIAYWNTHFWDLSYDTSFLAMKCMISFVNLWATMINYAA